MNRSELESRVRSITRDLNGTLFRKFDVFDFLNEGIERCMQAIDELDGMSYLKQDKDVPTHLPPKWHHLLAVYCAARLYHQDEQHYQAGTLMNEFESKIAQLKQGIEAGEIIITDPETGEPVDATSGNVDYVTNSYFIMRAVEE